MLSSRVSPCWLLLYVYILLFFCFYSSLLRFKNNIIQVPEGLPLAVTLALVYAQSQMANEPFNCMVRRMEACETMGNATAICSDKTGTLTTNKMVVSRAFLGGEVLTKIEMDPTRKPLGSGFDEKFQTRIRDCLALCSGKDSKIITKSADKDSISAKGDSVKYQGNPTECALLGFADQCKFVKKDIYTWRDEDMKKEKNYPTGLHLFAFESSIKRMSIVVKNEDGGSTIFTKGAAERVIQLCNRYMAADGTIKPIDKKFLDEVDKQIGICADDQLRNISLAYRDLKEGADEWKSLEKGFSEKDVAFQKAMDAYQKKLKAKDDESESKEEKSEDGASKEDDIGT